MEMDVKDRLLVGLKLEKFVCGKYQLRARAPVNLIHPSGRYLFPL